MYIEICAADFYNACNGLPSSNVDETLLRTPNNVNNGRKTSKISNGSAMKMKRENDKKIGPIAPETRNNKQSQESKIDNFLNLNKQNPNDNRSSNGRKFNSFGYKIEQDEHIQKLMCPKQFPIEVSMDQFVSSRNDKEVVDRSKFDERDSSFENNDKMTPIKKGSGSSNQMISNIDCLGIEKSIGFMDVDRRSYFCQGDDSQEFIDETDKTYVLDESSKGYFDEKRIHFTFDDTQLRHRKSPEFKKLIKEFFSDEFSRAVNPINHPIKRLVIITTTDFAVDTTKIVCSTNMNVAILDMTKRTKSITISTYCERLQNCQRSITHKLKSIQKSRNRSKT